MIDLSTAKSLGFKTGIDPFSVIREYVQIAFLNEIYAQPKIGKTVFKGGTALRLMFASNRFSEDLDFTTDLSKKDLDGILADVIGELEKEIPNLEIRDLDTIAGISKKISIKIADVSQPLTIKLDFSLREEVFLTKQGVIKTALPVSSSVLIDYLDPVEVLAEKYRAIMTRIKGRDLYDVWYLLNKGIKFDQKLIQKKLDFYKSKIDWAKFTERIEGWDEKELDQDLRKFLPEKDRQVIGKLKELVLEEIKML